jgi:hypothetical protein
LRSLSPSSQPTKSAAGGLVPGARRAQPVEQVGWPGEGGERRRQAQGDRPLLLLGRQRRIAAGRQLEEIGALGPRQPQRPGQAAKRRRRDSDLAALLDPAHPGRAEAAELRQLLAPQARRAAARPGGQAELARRQALAVGPQERAERTAAAGVGIHVTGYTRIRSVLVPVS